MNQPQSWVNQDWSKTDMEIGRERKMSRQAVNHMRRVLNSPQPPKRPLTMRKYEALEESRLLLEKIQRVGCTVSDFIPAFFQKTFEELRFQVDDLLSRWPKS